MVKELASYCVRYETKIKGILAAYDVVQEQNIHVDPDEKEEEMDKEENLDDYYEEDGEIQINNA